MTEPVFTEKLHEIDSLLDQQKFEDLQNEVQLIRKRREIKNLDSTNYSDSTCLHDVKAKLNGGSSSDCKLSASEDSSEFLKNENFATRDEISNSNASVKHSTSSSNTRSTAIEKSQSKSQKNDELADKPLRNAVHIDVEEAKEGSPTAAKTRQTMREMDEDLKTLEQEIENIKRAKSSCNGNGSGLDSTVGAAARPDYVNKREKNENRKNMEKHQFLHVENQNELSVALAENYGSTSRKEICKLSFEDKDEILVELETALGQKYAEPADKKPGETYRCRFCGLTYNYMTTLRAHERVHDIDEPYVCNRCGLSYRYHSELQVHSQEHKGERGFKCECGRVFSKYYDLLNHTHPGEEDPSMAGNGNFHESAATTGGFHGLAGGTATVAADFEVLSAKVPPFAVRNYPNPRKSYYCQFCCKGYTTANELKYHIYGHRGERQFTVGASRYLMNRL